MLSLHWNSARPYVLVSTNSLASSSPDAKANAAANSTGNTSARSEVNDPTTVLGSVERAVAAIAGNSIPAMDQVESTTSQIASSQIASSMGSAASPAALEDDVARLKLEIEIADSIDALMQESHGSRRRGSNDATQVSGSRTSGPSPEFIIPKVIIAEVRSHNDPAFVSVVRRQVAMCRSEERTMSLVAIRVEPDGEEENLPSLQSLGLASWQQKLVNWMSDHPEIHDPYAFVSSAGELILTLLDIERNCATGLLRQGLIEVLTGQVMASEASSLSRAAMPARYHGGIASVCSPSAGFEAEQLIEATYRCLAAAERHGKASIKSIEVF